MLLHICKVEKYNYFYDHLCGRDVDNKIHHSIFSPKKEPY